MKNIKHLIMSVFALSISMGTVCFHGGYDLDTKNVSYALSNSDDLDIFLKGDSKVSRGNNELMDAVIDSNYDNVESLLKKNSIDIDSVNDDGMTALHFAAEAGDGLILRLLLDYGALINVVDHQGNSPLHLAANKNAFTVAQDLIDNGADVSLINVENKTPFDLSRNNRMRAILSDMY